MSKRSKSRRNRRINRATLKGVGPVAPEPGRYPGGQCRPPQPNARVLEQRRALAGEKGDLATATIPLDLAHARGWISEAHHRTGMRLKGLYLAAGLRGPRITASAGAEVETANDDQPFSLTAKSAYATMSDADIAGIWDGTFNKADARVSAMRTLDPKAYDHLDDMGNEVAARALANWRKANDAMSPAEQNEVFNVCILDSFPFWITDWAAGRTETARSYKRTLLISGLEKAASALRKPVERHSEPARWVDPGPKPRAPKLVAERTKFVDGEGALVLEVVKVARRGQG